MPSITAHTGCMYTIDNSIDSLKAAISLHCELAEVDVSSTADGVLILNHDDNIIDENGRTYLLKSTTYTTLKTIRQANGLLGVVRLEEYLEEARGRIVVNLDVKTMDVIVPTAALLFSINMQNDAVLTGCELPFAIYNKGLGLGIRYMLDTGLFIDPKHPHESDAYRCGYRRMTEAALRNGCGGLNIRYDLASEELVAYAHARYMPVCAWTCNDPAHAVRLKNMGIDSITSRRPDVVIAAVR